MYKLLILIVDTNPQRDIISIEKMKPEKIIFLITEETKDRIPQIIETLKERAFYLNPAQYEQIHVDNPFSFSQCLQKMRSELDYYVDSWRNKGNGFSVFVDFSSGAKPLSGALVLIAHRWDCGFIYVSKGDYDDERQGYTFDDVIDFTNPWDELGLQAREETIIMFNRHYYYVASEILEKARDKVNRTASKQELNSLKTLVDAYGAWDRFDHESALHHLKLVFKNISKFSYLFSHNVRFILEEYVLTHIDFLEKLLSCKKENIYLVYDLIANARRRARDSRYDDAVGRLYRCVEAMAQIRLNEIIDINENNEILNEDLSEEIKESIKGNIFEGRLELGLQQAYHLLNTIGDPLGERFYKLKLIERNSPLSGRNKSILAHGFVPVDKKIWERLYKIIFELGNIHKENLPVFPQIDWC